MLGSKMKTMLEMVRMLLFFAFFRIVGAGEAAIQLISWDPLSFFCFIWTLGPRRSIDSNHSYGEETTRPGYSSLIGGDGTIPGQQEMLDRLTTMTQVLKQNQQAMDSLLRILESHDLVPKKSPFEDPTRL
jgi:hypothetical protein